MTTIIRRKRTSRTELGPYRRHELLTGKIVYPVEGYTGYGDGSGRDLAAFISNDMRADWEANRDELLAFWRSGECTVSAIFANSKPWLFAYGSPDTLPWAARVLDKGGG
jgi:hypothetical protein